MWNAIHEGNFDAASLEMMDSKWARQVGSRARKLSDAMKSGEF
jgi:lysozyme